MEKVTRWSLKPEFLVSMIYYIVFTLFLLLTRMNRSYTYFVPILLLPLAMYLAIYYLMSYRDLVVPDHLIWGVAIALRITTLFFPVGMSDDIYRYLWDGHVQHSGFNPYRYPPNADELVSIRTESWSSINNADIPSPYPPGMQIVFYLLTSFPLSTQGYIFLFRIVMMTFDLGLIVVIRKMLILWEKAPQLLLIFAWSPLAILEFTGNAHNDVIALFFMMLALYLAFSQDDRNSTRQLLSAVFIILALLFKLFPAIAVPFLIYRWRLKEWSVAFLTAVLPSLLYVSMTVNPLLPSGQLLFVMYFRFNESIFRVYDYLFSLIGFDQIFARYFLLVCLSAIAIALLFTYYHREKGDRKDSIMNFLGCFMLIALLLGPDVQPWYVLWVLPIAVIIDDRAAIVFSATVMLSYVIYPKYDTSNIWMEQLLTLILEYAPVYLLLFSQFRRRKYFMLGSGVGNSNYPKASETDI